MARPNGVREAWQQGRAVINSWLGIPSSFSAEVMASMGWDSLVVDMQHGMIDYQMMVTMLQGISTTNVTPLVRVPWNDPAHIQKAVDAGARRDLYRPVGSIDLARLCAGRRQARRVDDDGAEESPRRLQAAQGAARYPLRRPVLCQKDDRNGVHLRHGRRRQPLYDDGRPGGAAGDALGRCGPGAQIKQSVLISSYSSARPAAERVG